MSQSTNEIVRKTLKQRGPVTQQEFDKQCESYVLASMRGKSNFSDAEIKALWKGNPESKK